MGLAGNVLLLGAGGMLGRAWQAVLDGHDRLQAPPRSQCDLTDAAQVERFVSTDVDLVINCSAYTDVDGAESDDETADAVNGDAVGRLARRCRKVDALLVHYSTDYVFNGRHETPYGVDSAIDPVNAYGRSKARGERLLAESGCRHLLIRTSWLYAPWGRNFVLTILEAAGRKPLLQVVNDQWGRPTSCRHLAETTRTLLERRMSGIWHLTDGGSCTWFDLARHIVEHAGADCRVEPCGTDAFPRPARRPGYSVLDLTRTRKVLGTMTPWQENVSRAVNEVGEQR